jgi:heme A synthase
MSEDLDRELDGVPHDVVGGTVFAAAALGALALFLLVAVHWAVALGVGVLSLPILVSTLTRRSDRERDHVHPSR